MILLVVGPGVGFLMTAISMLSAFHTLGQNGISDPKVLAGDIGMTLSATVIGIIVGVFGFATMIVAAILQFLDGNRVPPNR